MTPQPWTPGEGAPGDKRHAPATLRNRDAIVAVLRDWLPATGSVLEVASGSGEHALHFAAAFPDMDWQPTDPDPAGLTSIAAYRVDAGLANIAPPIALDAASDVWPLDRADAILCINMVHISEWAATVGLFTQGSKLLQKGAPLVLYGPYFRKGHPTAPSNAAFDESLKARNSEWGVRWLEEVSELAETQCFALAEVREMPANNLMLLYRRV